MNEGHPRSESGETRRPRRLLPSAPGDRYAPTRSPDLPPEPVPTSLPPAFAYGLVGAVAAAVVWGVASVVLGQELSLLLVGAVMGWIVGTAVAFGAWGRRPHVADPRPGTVAVTLALLAFGLGLVASWLLGALTLPGSTQSLPERLAAVPLVDAVASQLGPFQLAGVVLGALVAWRSAR